MRTDGIESAGSLLHCIAMSVALWPAFEDGQKHGLCDEGVSVLRAYEDLDAIAKAAGRKPLSAFDQHADVPDDVIAQLAEEAQDIPDLSGFPVVWHDPADAVATLDVLLSATAPDPAWAGTADDLAYCLEAFRQTLQQAAMRQTRSTS
jgi:hypothetical protein